MNVLERSKSYVEYGRKLVDSAVQGARAGEDKFLKEESPSPFLSGYAQQALGPAVLGACLGALGGCFANGQRSKGRILACGLLGGAVGFTAGVLWDSRHFTGSIASEAWKSIGKTRDEHWFERNPIDYA
ncbi:MAG TPA: hypothetical protein VGS05_06575 [Candidatus Sulfotelmatobacter sp.]|nr:hypothetical protein [Candidatus Sulfotelmatobacter sp.]